MNTDRAKETAQFHQPLAPAIRTVTMIALAVIVVATVVRILAGSEVIDLLVYLVFIAMCIAFLRMHLTTTITPEGINIRGWWGMINTTVPAKEITGAGVGPTTTWVDGTGIRFKGNAQAYVVGGPTLEIQRRTAPYLVSVPDPQAAVEAVERIILRR